MIVDTNDGGNGANRNSNDALPEVRDGEPPLEVLGESVVYRERGGVDFTVTQVALRDTDTGNHFAVHYASVKDGRSGAVCVAMCGGRILLARHWRIATGSWEWEFPRGMGERGESPEQTALREFHEETGLHADSDSAVTLQCIHADTGVLKDSIAIVGLTVLDTVPDSGSD